MTGCMYVMPSPSLYTVPYGNHGCACGDINNAFLYVIDNDGVDTYSSYPFKSKVSHDHYASIAWKQRSREDPTYDYVAADKVGMLISRYRYYHEYWV